MQRIAIIDIGSNSARLVITQMYKSGAYNMVYNQKETLRLSQKVNTNGELTETAFTDTLECMNSFASMCELFHANKIIAVATAAIRNAPNGKDLVLKVKEATGITLEIISRVICLTPSGPIEPIYIPGLSLMASIPSKVFMSFTP